MQSQNAFSHAEHVVDLFADIEQLDQCRHLAQSPPKA